MGWSGSLEVFGNGRFVSSDVSIVDEIELVEVPAVGLVFWWHEAPIGASCEPFRPS